MYYHNNIPGVNLKILIISQCFYPENFQINETAIGLQKKGHQVTVVTGYPNYPAGEIYKEYKNKKCKTEYLEGVKIVRVNMQPRKTGAINLLINYLTYAISATIKVLSMNESYDVIYVFQVSPITQIIPANIAKIKWKIPLIVNCQDVWPDSICVKGIKTNSLIFKLTKILSIQLYGQANRIITSSPGFDPYLIKELKVSKKRIINIQNYGNAISVDQKEIMDGRINVMFAGNIGLAQDLGTIVKAVNILEDQYRHKLIINIVGDGSNLESLKQEIKDNKLEDNIYLHGYVDSNMISEYYHNNNALIITLGDLGIVSETIPSKLQVYMSTGLPIIGAINGATKDIINKVDCGKCTTAGDYNGLSKILKDLIINYDEYKIKGYNGIKYFEENYTYENYVNNIEKVLINTQREVPHV